MTSFNRTASPTDMDRFNRSSRPSLGIVKTTKPTTSLLPTSSTTLSVSSESPSSSPTLTRTRFVSPLLEMTLFGLNTTLESTIAQNHWRDVTSKHVKNFWNAKYYYQQLHSSNITDPNATGSVPMLVVTFTLEFVDTFIDSQTLSIRNTIRSRSSLLQSLANPSDSAIAPANSSTEIASLVNRIQYTQHYVYNQTTQTLFTSYNKDSSTTNDTLMYSNEYSGFLNISEYVPVVPFITPSDVQTYMTLLQTNDPTPTEIFSRINAGPGNNGLFVQIQSQREPSSPPALMTSSPTNTPTSRGLSQRPTMVPSPYRSKSSAPIKLRASFKPTNKPTASGATVLSYGSVHTTLIAAIVVIVVAGLIIIAWLVWYLFYYKSRSTSTMVEQGGYNRNDQEDPPPATIQRLEAERVVDSMNPSTTTTASTPRHGPYHFKTRRKSSLSQSKRKDSVISPSQRDGKVDQNQPLEENNNVSSSRYSPKVNRLVRKSEQRHSSDSDLVKKVRFCSYPLSKNVDPSSPSLITPSSSPSHEMRANFIHYWTSLKQRNEGGIQLEMARMEQESKKRLNVSRTVSMSSNNPKVVDESQSAQCVEANNTMVHMINFNSK